MSRNCGKGAPVIKKLREKSFCYQETEQKGLLLAREWGKKGLLLARKWGKKAPVIRKPRKKGSC